MKIIKKLCEFCGMEFNITSVAERKRIKQFGVGAKFCSRKCAGAHKSAQFNHPSVNRKCECCEKDFVVEKPCKKTRFCSKKCAYEFRENETDVKLKQRLPEIITFRKTHTLEETARAFSTSLASLRRQGVYSTEQQLTCPDELGDVQREILNGNMLGDGCIPWVPLIGESDRNTHFTIRQKQDFVEYIDGLYGIYQPYSCPVQSGEAKKPSRVDGKISHKVEHWNGEYCYYSFLYTLTHPVFTKERIRWYEEPYVKKSRKIVPSDLRLTWRTAAIWMCDDGSNHGNDVIVGRTYNPRYLMLHTESFTFQDVEFLISRLKDDLGIIGTVNRHNGKPTIRVGSDDWFEFIENIKPYIPWSCFQYKCINRKKVDKNKSGFEGVHFHHGKWYAYKSFRMNGVFKHYHIGSFSTAEEASEARERWLLNRRDGYCV